MWIRKVVARSFGAFEDEDLDLTPGMNVICGPNEAGKSTWHGALYAALCGVRRARGRLRSDVQEFSDQHRPWNQERWEVSAEVVLSDGRHLELFHDLDGKVDARITDLDTGADISAAHMFDGAPDGSNLLGLNRDIVPSTIFVRQADILAVTENASALQEQLQRAAATSGRDATAEEALRLIKEYRSEEVGTDRTNSTKPLRSAITMLERRRQALEAAQQEHAEYVSLVQKAREAQAEAAEAENRLGIARALESRQELEELTRRLEAAETIQRDLPAERPPEKRRLAAEAEELRNALSAFRGRPDTRPVPEGRSASAIDAELEGLPEAPQGDVEVHDSVSRAFDRWKDRRSALDAAQSDPADPPETEELEGTSPSELRRLADVLEGELPDVDSSLGEQLKIAREAEANPLKGPVGLVGAALAAGGLALLASGSLMPGAGLLLLGFFALVVPFLRRPKAAASVSELEGRIAVQQEQRKQEEEKHQKARDRLQDLGLSFDPNELRNLARSTDSAATDRERHVRWQRRVEELSRELTTAEAELREALERRGLADAVGSEIPAGDLVERYRLECRRRSEQAVRAGRREDLQAELKARQEVERNWKEDQRRRLDLTDGLTRALGAVGIREIDSGQLENAAAGWLKDHEEAERRNQEARERWSKLEGVLQGETAETLRNRIEALKKDLPPLPDGSDAEEASILIQEIPRLEKEAREKARQANELKGRAADRAEKIADVALAEEEHEMAVVELDRVQHLDDILRRTHDFLSVARDRVQRELAPRLKTALERNLSRVTGGRYSEVIVDAESLSVQVKDDRGQWRPAHRLSHGTKEQVYLLLRIGLLDFITTTDEIAPLILDDVTVQSDSNRTVEVLESLLELSEDRQVVVFSQEQEVLAWARTRLGGERNALIQLPPAGAVAEHSMP